MNFAPSTNPAYQKLSIAAICEEANEVKTLVLEAEGGLAYRAGQFLTLVFGEGEKEERRSYSFSSSPESEEPMSITLKRVPNGKYSRPLTESFKPGDILSTSGVSGQFVLPAEHEGFRQLFFFAAGIGIVPVFSLIKTLLYSRPKLRAVLVYSNTTVAQTVFYQEILELQQKYQDRFRVEFLFSTSPDLERARLSKWLLPQLLELYAESDKKTSLFYTCGPFAYMRMVRLTLEEAGYEAEQIRKEQFDTTLPVLKQEPPDKGPHDVTVEIDDKTYRFPVQYPKTILGAAKEHGVLLPYSCETGKCGSCAALCREGKVWMSYNEVLTDKDLREGKVLTCTGYPQGGNVRLEVL